MSAPITEPNYTYADAAELALDGLPIYEGIFQLEDPCLILSDIDWQPDRTGMRHYMGEGEAAPEMGIELDEDLGGMLSVLVLCYGDFPNLHKRCINSIIRSLPVYRLDLRVALNCVGPGTKEYIESIPTTKVYTYDENKYKYPIMRDMLYDTETPLLGDYVAWFDDNAFVSESNWVNTVANSIKKQSSSVGMYGIRMYQPMSQGNDTTAQEWVETREWYLPEIRHSTFVTIGFG